MLKQLLGGEKRPEASEIQIKRRNKEGYKFAYKDIRNGVLVQIEINKKLVISRYTTPAQKRYIFDIVLDYRFPFYPPQILARNSFSEPSIADGRDIFEDITKREWSPSLTIFEIVQKIPKFITEVQENQFKTDEELKLWGTFHLGEMYNIHDWMTYPASVVFTCQQQKLDTKERKILMPRLLVISEGTMGILEPTDKKNNLGTLLFWSTLHSLDAIQRNLNQMQYISFSWKSDSGEIYEENFAVDEADTCIELISKNMKKLGLAVNKQISGRKIKEDEVTGVSKIDIGKVLTDIERYEVLIQQELTFDYAQSLMQAYQQAVEHYSAENNREFDKYVSKLHSLFEDSEVQNILEQKVDNKGRTKGNNQMQYSGVKKGADEKQEGRRDPNVREVEDIVDLVSEETKEDMDIIDGDGLSNNGSQQEPDHIIQHTKNILDDNQSPKISPEQIPKEQEKENEETPHHEQENPTAEPT